MLDRVSGRGQLEITKIAGYFLFFSTARGHAKLGEYFSKMRNREIEVLESRPDYEGFPNYRRFQIQNKKGV